MRGWRACSLAGRAAKAARSIEAARADLELRVAHARDVISGTQPNGETGALMGGAHRKMPEHGGLVEDPLCVEVPARGHRLRSLREDGVYRCRVMSRSTLRF